MQKMQLVVFSSLALIVCFMDVTHGKTVRENQSIYSRLTPAQMLPSGKYLKLKKLMRRIGNHFDPEWMAVAKPDDNLADQNKLHADNQMEVNNYLKELRQWSETFFLNTNTAKNNTLQNLLRYLSHLPVCNVTYQWEDMGPLFWPRYLKSGTCESRGRSCSWPRGMTCQPGKPHLIRVLRWVCKRRVRKSKKKIANRTHGKYSKSPSNKNKVKIGAGKIKCKWKPIPYEVTSKCVCSCST